MVLSIDVSYFVACSRIFRGQSPPAATSRLFGSRINAEDDIMPKVTSESASGRGLINLMLFSKISFSLLLMFFTVGPVPGPLIVRRSCLSSRDLYPSSSVPWGLLRRNG
ncbi:uncharacterized protein CTRU02_207790 [Colletotrichum truncatum]|uniref:Uncharacterized protein n=2 Tax=Colletotrichum truncatum TaxID=5467 RepID=A0ACC3Z1U3_COLTU|nr:uncharacterized protein CTRU02_15134 [Colletotrichum truncatum]KAF6781351.1 hypothetical protein CTRU02_15134 [Colletotrichum truncatum]